MLRGREILNGKIMKIRINLMKDLNVLQLKFLKYLISTVLWSVNEKVFLTNVKLKFNVH